MFLEATVVGDGLDAARIARRDRALAAIERIDSPDFMLMVSIEDETEHSPPMRELRKHVASWVRGLDWEVLHERQERRFDRATLPRLSVRAGEWRFAFEAVARAPARRGSGGRTIASEPADGGCFDHSMTLRGRLEEKARKYGRVEYPVVIAVRHDGLGVDDRDVQAALFGPRIGTFDPALGVLHPTGRRGDGFWCSSGRARNRHVAGVLLFSTELRPWSVARQHPALWLHPSPTVELPALPWQRAELVDGHVRKSAGRFDPTTTLELPDIETFADPEQWPGPPELRD